MLQRRLMSSTVLLLGVVLAAYYLHVIGVWLLMTFVASAALLEFYGLIEKAHLRAYRYFGVAGGAVLITATFAATGCRIDLAGTPAAEWLCCAMCAVVIATLIRQFPQKHNDQLLVTLACTLMGLMYVSFLFNYFVLLAFSWDAQAGNFVGRAGVLLVFYLIAVVKVADTGAFAVGSLMGRHKLFPRISPGKTWEGLIAALLSGVIASVVFCRLVGGDFGSFRMNMRQSIVLGVLLAGIGLAGDLVESQFKRAAGVKDAGAIVPGMGGLLDFLDSLLFAAPALYYYARFVLT